MFFAYELKPIPTRARVFACLTVTTTSFTPRYILRQDFWYSLLHKDQQPATDMQVLQAGIPAEKSAGAVTVFIRRTATSAKYAGLKGHGPHSAIFWQLFTSVSVRAWISASPRHVTMGKHFVSRLIHYVYIP
jgi:hypothetical protein